MIHDDEQGPDTSDYRPGHDPGTEEDSHPTLRYKVVEYPTGPDRCTVYEPGASGVELMSTWISLNASSLIDLDRAR